MFDHVVVEEYFPFMLAVGALALIVLVTPVVYLLAKGRDNKRPPRFVAIMLFIAVCFSLAAAITAPVTVYALRRTNEQAVGDLESDYKADRDEVTEVRQTFKVVADQYPDMPDTPQGAIGVIPTLKEENSKLVGEVRTAKTEYERDIKDLDAKRRKAELANAEWSTALKVDNPQEALALLDRAKNIQQSPLAVVTCDALASVAGNPLPTRLECCRPTVCVPSPTSRPVCGPCGLQPTPWQTISRREIAPPALYPSGNWQPSGAYTVGRVPVVSRAPVVTVPAPFPAIPVPQYQWAW